MGSRWSVTDKYLGCTLYSYLVSGPNGCWCGTPSYRVGHLMQKVGHHRGLCPKATCKASSGVPLYNVCNGQHGTYGTVTALFFVQWGTFWDFGSFPGNLPLSTNIKYHFCPVFIPLWIGVTQRRIAVSLSVKGLHPTTLYCIV